MTERTVGPSWPAAVIVIAIGVAVALPGGIVIMARTIREVSSKAMATPGVSQRRLGSGTWFIYQRTGSSTGGVVFHNSPLTLRPSDVSVVDPNGNRLTISDVTVEETLTQNGRIYTAAVQFDAPSSGLYEVQITTPNSSVIVSRSLGYTFRGLLGFIALSFVGGLVVLVGVVLLIVGVVRRSHAASNQGGPPAWRPASAGFYPDQQSGGMRWWDGYRWIDQRG